MIKQKIRRFSLIVVQTLFSILLVLIFAFLFFRYYAPETQKIVKENPRFVHVDLNQLQSEADALTSNYSNGTARSIFVLTYHKLSKNNSEQDYQMSYDEFKANMFALKQAGYQTVSLDDLYLFLQGQKQLPDKSFVLTFDDAAKAGYYNADPVLRVLNYTAVMFVITGHSLVENQSAYYLNKTDLDSVLATGRWQLESHTDKSHLRLPIDSNGDSAPALTNKLWIPSENRMETDEEYFNRISQDLSNSKSLLENTFNIKVDAFALPYGDFGERGSNYEEAHNLVYDLTSRKYKLVFYEFPIKNRAFKGNYPSGFQSTYLVARLPAESFRTPERLLQRVESSRPIDLPYYEDYQNQDRWPRISGGADFANDSITLKNDENSLNILFSYLDGSYLWRDYKYSIQVLNTVPSVSLLARLTGSMDYVACRYMNGSINILNSNGGVQERVASLSMQNFSIQSGDFISISVSGSNVSCSLNGVDVISTQIQNISDHGGVGVRAEGFQSQDKTFQFGNIYAVEESPR